MKKITKLKLLILLLLSSINAYSQFEVDYIDSNQPGFKPEYFALGLKTGATINNLRGLDGYTVSGL